MVTETKAEEKTEQSTESALEDAVLSDTSGTEVETPTDEAETTEGKDKKEKPDLELEKLLKHPKVVSHLQSEKDKAVNQYRETREGDTALIRSQAAKIKELTLGQSGAKLTKAMQAVLAGDEEEGFETDKLEAKRKGFEEIKATILEYNERAAEVMEVAELATTLANKLELDKEVIAHFHLNDANPAVRARGMIEAIERIDHFLDREEAFNKILEEIPLLQKGSEVRKQIDSFIEQYMELPPGKARDLLISKLKREMSVSPKQKPPTPSGDSGGIDLSKLSGEELLRQAVAEDRRKHR